MQQIEQKKRDFEKIYKSVIKTMKTSTIKKQHLRKKNIVQRKYNLLGSVAPLHSPF